MFLTLSLVTLLGAIGFIAYHRFSFPISKKFVVTELSSKADEDAVEPSQNIVLVTGGCGFIASHIAENLLASDEWDEIRLLDIKSNSPVNSPKIKHIVGDFQDYQTVLKAVDGCKAVFHNGSLIDLRETEYMEAILWNTNVQGTWNVLEACIRRKVKALVYTSSHLTCHTEKVKTTCETEADIKEFWRTTPNPIAYGRSKRTASDMVLACNGRAGLNTSIVMSGLVIGPRNSRIIGNILNGPPVEVHDPKIFGDQPLISAKQCAAAHLVAMKKTIEGDPNVCGELFFVFDLSMCYGQLSWDLRKALRKETDRVVPWIYPILATVSPIINWVFNNQINSPFIQATFTSYHVVYHGPKLGSNAKAQKYLGFKPEGLQPMMDVITDYYVNGKKMA